MENPPTKTPAKTPNRLPIVWALFGCALAMALTACGGGGSPDNFLEAAAEAAGQASGADIDDIQFDDDGFSANVDGADITFGGTGNTDRPDWLEPEFIWPDGFVANYAVNDESTGERGYVGIVPGGDGDALAAEQTSRLLAAGYERLGDSNVYLLPGRPPLEVNIGNVEGQGVGIDVRTRGEDEQVLRDVYAPVEGDGTMAVSLGDDDYLFEGPCSLVSDGGSFTTANPLNGTTTEDGSITLNVREGEQDYILSNVAIASTTEFEAWTMLQQDDAGNLPVVAVTGQGFSVEGFMVDFNTGEQAPVTIAVSCPG